MSDRHISCMLANLLETWYHANMIHIDNQDHDAVYVPSHYHMFCSSWLMTVLTSNCPISLADGYSAYSADTYHSQPTNQLY